MIAIVDYGMGNVASVRNALKFLGVDGVITMDPKDLRAATHIILPGVGAFADGMAELRKRDLVTILNTEALEHKKPFLGICLGMQLLASSGEEGGETKGLGFVLGHVRRLRIDESKYRLPHIGWDTVSFKRESNLFTGIGANDFYFVHSYALEAEDEADVIATCEYGAPFTVAVERGNVFGTQFHPEKSQKSGLALLKNFIDIHA